MNIVFWNCQGLRPKRKELQNYLLENQIDILALNETFLKPKFKFHLPGYDIYKHDRLVGTKDGVAILVYFGPNFLLQLVYGGFGVSILCVIVRPPKPTFFFDEI